MSYVKCYCLAVEGRAGKYEGWRLEDEGRKGDGIGVGGAGRFEAGEGWRGRCGGDSRSPRGSLTI